MFNFLKRILRPKTKRIKAAVWTIGNRGQMVTAIGSIPTSYQYTGRKNHQARIRRYMTAHRN